jgi:membrane peptidoglycan carboxypeptidase
LSAQRKANGGGSRRAGKGRPASRKAETPKKSLPRRILKWGLLTALVGFLLGCAAFAYGYMSTDIPDPNKDFEAQTTFVYYADGKAQIGRFATQNRVSVPLSEVPDHVQDAVIAAEDRTFYTNRGIDPKGILRAAFSNARGNATQGASTITQQYVKIFYLSSERTLDRKIKEAFVSLKLQQEQSKQEILQGYLNTIYFGRGAYGVQAAAQAYFDKDVEDLSVREGAALAAILNSPENYDPADGKDAKQRLTGRYRYVLDGMADMGTLPAERAATAERRLPRFPEVQKADQYGGQRGYMMDMVKKELRAEGFSDAEIEGGGLRVTTTFRPKVMRAASQAVAAERPKGLKGLHVASASVDPATGALRGFYAGQDYLKSNGGINWAVAGGSPGSAFKPFALAAGIKDGFSLKSTFDGNSPYLFPNGDKVVNEGPGDGNDYGSAISLTKATEESVNTAYVDLTMSMKGGPQKIFDTAVDMGVPENAPGLEPTSGISLGSATINPIDMANGYATIADGGQAKDWFVISKVESATGKDLYKRPIKTDRVIPEDIDRDVSYALQQVVKNGTGRNALALGRPAAGKTGTATNGNDDVSSSWFVGYTPQLSTAVMYVRGDGNDALNCEQPNAEVCTPGYMPSYFGADYPTRTWTATMRAALEGLPIEQFPPPANVKATTDLEGHEPLPTYTPPPPTPTKKTSTPPPPTTSAPPPPTTSAPPPPPSTSSTPGPPTCLPGTCPSPTSTESGGGGGGGNGGGGGPGVDGTGDSG